ncbi:hypothetical protein RN001_000557 [Aquatica leii]|uniref:Uncharacterized protein n=1 Tax=Aquatica leii TaxID=1421715 RepID=A0AAN7PMF5_9COLE|nr:hypothetical protein RN001_000557 [Aquatica leii]
MSIVVVENKILKHLLPVLKSIQLNIFEDVESTILSEKNLNEKMQILHKHLHTCISVLEVLDSVLECLSKKEQIGLGDVASVPINIIEILYITFEHCKNSNILYKGLSNTNEILDVFKLSQEIHKKVLIFMNCRVNIKEAQTHILKSFLQSLVKIGKILGCMNMKSLADNWRGYLDVSQKFFHVLNGNYSIKDAIQCLSLDIDKNLKSLLKNNENTKNLNSITKLCNFLIKIIAKICDVFLRDSQEDWETTFHVFLRIYSYHPCFLRYQVYPDVMVNEIEGVVFSSVDILLGTLCAKSEFCKMLINCKEMHTSSEKCLLLMMNVFKKINLLLKTNANIQCVPQLIDIFFNVLSKGYFEFWKLILITPNHELLYEEIIRNVAQIMRLLSNEEYNEVECVLFKNIFSDSIWCSLMANDIWQLALRGEAQLSYETMCGVLKQTEVHLKENFAVRPQLIFLKNLLSQLAKNLSENHKQFLFDQYPLDRYLHLWKTLGFQSVPKSQLGAITFIHRTVVGKSILLINKKLILEDFTALCDALEALCLIPKNDKSDLSQLKTVLLDLWKFIFSNDWRDSFYSKYFIRKLIIATNNLLLEFNNEQLLQILNNMSLLVDTGVDLKILLITSLSVLSKKVPEESPERNQICTKISAIFCKLFKDKNQIIQHKTLEVFFSFDKVSAYNVIIQNVIKHDYDVERRRSNFAQKNIVANKSLNWQEYFQVQSDYKFSHQCPLLTNLKSNDLLTHNQFFSKGEDNRDKIDEVVKTIKTNIEMFYKLSGKHGMTEESTTEIMRILNK